MRIGLLVAPELVAPEAPREAAKNRPLVTNRLATSLMLDIAAHRIENGIATEMLERNPIFHG